MNISQSKEIVLNLLDTFDLASRVSIDLRKKGLKKEIKKDLTPVTNGDIEVNNILTSKITNLTPNIPIVSEETVDNKNNKELNNFWLIDPIDGTYDYINNGDEFTINAALIIDKKPSIGIIYAPAKNRFFYSYGNKKSFEKKNNEVINLSEDIKKQKNEIVAVSYSNNLKPQIVDIHNKYKVDRFQKMKSSYKFCVIAADEYDLYAAEPRACEWDIAAGHAILEHAGGSITDFDYKKIIYGKKNFKNPSLILKSKSMQHG
ncbi:3'(2'),5'-bisphosphate nucleotidase CysQ [Candidatus Pelagibacter sp.]|nr:3'(2'),5'-bisphosphate nucleotidase CysQ [Candidatus Pelagibacter sp.]